MSEDSGNLINRIDRFGGKAIGRFWGAILLGAVLLIAVPIAIGAMVDGDWLGMAVAMAAAALGFAAVRYLFSSRRRLSEFE